MAAVTDWAAIEAGIWDMVKATTELPDDHIIWTHEMGPRPPENPYITLLVTSSMPVGRGWAKWKRNTTTITSRTFTADAGTELLTAVAAHTLNTGDGPIRLTTTGTLPAPLAPATDYWPIRVSATGLRLADTLARANLGTALNLTDAGTGTHTLVHAPLFTRLNEGVITKARGGFYAALSIQCFADVMAGPGGAMHILGNIVMGHKLHTWAMHAAGIGTGGFGAILPVGNNRKGSAIEPRATVEFLFHHKAEAIRLEPGFDRVEVENENTGATFEVPDPD